MASGQVSTTLSEWLVVFLIVFSLIFEAVLHRIERWINQKHQHIQSVVRVLYRELMVLGLVSFLFIVYETIAKPSGDTILSFEFAHVFIFLLAIFYTGVVLSTMFFSLRLSARWKKMEQVDLVKYLHLKEEYTRLRLRMHRHHGPWWRKFRWWFPNFTTLWHYRNLHEVMAFHDIRFQFIFYRDLPEHFRFSSFLRKIKSITFIDLVESHWTIYAIFLLVVLFDILRRHLTDIEDAPGTDTVESAFFISAAILLAFMVQFLAHKIRYIYWELTKHPRVYYEGVEPAAVAEELAAAEQRLQAERAQRRRSRSGDASDDPGNMADDEAADARGASGDSAEAEMLDPMSPNPISTPLVLAGSPDPNKASPLVRNPSVDMLLTESAGPRLANFTPEQGASRLSASFAGRGAMSAASRSSSGPKTPLPDSMSHSVNLRHSMEYYHHRRSADRALADRAELTANHVKDVAKSRSSLGDRQDPRPTPPELAIPVEFQETAARHSLELMRHTVTAAPMRPQNVTAGASVALAAVAAARKRSVDGQYGRSSLDAAPDGERRSIGSPRILSRLSSRNVSTDDDARNSAGEFVRGSFEGRGRRGGRRSIELAQAMPHDEIVERHHHQHSLDVDRDLEAGIVRPRDVQGSGAGAAPASPSSPKRRGPRIRFALSSSENRKEDAPRSADDDSAAPQGQNSFMRSKSLGFMNATILKNLEHEEKAKTMEPANYPWIVKKIIPRLGRVASPVEKLFWFGSHKFFLWCVEFTLFFSTVLLAAATASLALLLLSKNDTNEATERAGESQSGSGHRDITALNIVSFTLPWITLIFVLFRIAGIMKKYIFILHNASLVPEAVAIEAIHKVSKKRPSYVRDDLSDVSGSETEREDEEVARERRRNLGRFFRSEAEAGNMPGIEPSSERASSAGSATAPARRAKKRRLALRLRRRKANSETAEIPEFPDEQATDKLGTE